MTDLIVLAFLLTAGVLPYWVAGRLAIPARERLAWGELGWPGRWRTVARGAEVLRPRGPWSGYTGERPR